MTRVKICGITSKTEVEFINRYLPDYIGFVFAASKRRVTPENAAELAAGLSPSILKAGVFVDMEPEEAAGIAALAGLDALQLCGSEDERYIAELRRRLKPGTEIWKAVRMGGDIVYESLEACSADRLILDTYNAKQAGGTGQTFDWGLTKQLRKHIRLPIILAGGLDPVNVRQAIEQVEPFAVDTSSGVEGVSVKDEAKVRSFIEAVRGESR
jgi:phosphoribosylanthranilate isomerase